MMTHDERRAWLDGLKPGDKVAIRGPVGRKDVYFYSLYAFVRRTKTTMVFKPLTSLEQQPTRTTLDGKVHGGSTWHQDYVEPVTDEVRRDIQVLTAHAYLRRLLDQLSNDDIVKLAKLAKENL